MQNGDRSLCRARAGLGLAVTVALVYGIVGTIRYTGGSHVARAPRADSLVPLVVGRELKWVNANLRQAGLAVSVLRTPRGPSLWPTVVGLRRIAPRSPG